MSKSKSKERSKYYCRKERISTSKFIVNVLEREREEIEGRTCMRTESAGHQLHCATTELRWGRPEGWNPQVIQVLRIVREFNSATWRTHEIVRSTQFVDPFGEISLVGQPHNDLRIEHLNPQASPLQM
jgi:hypothetical protein